MCVLFFINIYNLFIIKFIKYVFNIIINYLIVINENRNNKKKKVK